MPRCGRVATEWEWCTRGEMASIARGVVVPAVDEAVMDRATWGGRPGVCCTPSQKVS